MAVVDPDAKASTIFEAWEPEELDQLYDRVLEGWPESLTYFRQELGVAGVKGLSSRELRRLARLLRFGMRTPLDFFFIAEMVAGTTLEREFLGEHPATRPFRRAFAEWGKVRRNLRRGSRPVVAAHPVLPTFEESDSETVSV